MQPLLRRRLGFGRRYEDGIHLNFATGQHSVKAPGQGAQTGTFASLFTFTRASTATYLGSNGLVQTAAVDQPRIEYDASGNILGLLIEGARTNIALWSEDFTNAVWVNASTTDAANSAVAPDGATTADTVTASAANGTIAQNFVATATNAVRTFSVYLKRLTGTGTVSIEVGRTAAVCALTTSWQRFSVTDTALTGTYAVVANVVTVTATGHGLVTGDMVRADYTSGGAADFNSGAVTVLSADIFTYAQTTGDTTGNVTVYANLGRIKIATDTDAVYAWGGQGETVIGTGARSSYIPTTTASVARASDKGVRTVGAEYSYSGGTIVASATIDNPVVSATGFIFGALLLGSDTSGRTVLYNSTNATSLQSLVRDAGGTITANNAIAGTLTVPFKGAFAWSTNDFALYLNGTAATPDTSGALPTSVDTWVMGDGNNTAATLGTQHILRVNTYPTRQPNSFLQQKTA